MINLTNSYLDLPPLFYVPTSPTAATSPSWVAMNQPLARDLGLVGEDLFGLNGLSIFAGNAIPEGATPVALAYAGHQFGNFVPSLGDGRAVLLGELRSPDGISYDLQLKGSGQTPFSRRGDGRAALGPMMREYIIGEALHFLGIPATRTLAIVATGETVMRDRLLQGAIQSRIALGHTRVGTFQYAAYHGGVDAIRSLAEYVINRHYRDIGDDEARYSRLAESIIDRQASLVAQWMAVGFIHGVMNTDNISVAGESIDFGPCAFMNRYKAATVFSSIDRHGRYAFGAQPSILGWNLARLVECFIPLLADNEDKSIERAQEIVDRYPAKFRSYWYRGMRKKLGFFTEEVEDEDLITDLLSVMEKEKSDYTATFWALSAQDITVDESPFKEWIHRWRERIDPARNNRAIDESLNEMKSINPAVIARNHFVEGVIASGVEEGDFEPMERLVSALRSPFTEHSEFSIPPEGDDSSYRTFCGT